MQDKGSEQTEGYKYTEGKQETPETKKTAGLQTTCRWSRRQVAGPGRRQTKTTTKAHVTRKSRHMADIIKNTWHWETKKKAKTEKDQDRE